MIRTLVPCHQQSRLLLHLQVLSPSRLGHEEVMDSSRRCPDTPEVQPPHHLSCRFLPHRSDRHTHRQSHWYRECAEVVTMS